jgi:ATP adenylyltransferase
MSSEHNDLSSSVVSLENYTPQEIHAAILDSSKLAKKAQSLVSFKSSTCQVYDPVIGIHFAVRIAENLARKPTASSANKENDPFMPPFEDGLCVGKLDQAHYLLLNKFNVVDHHVLITTVVNEFQHSGIRKNAFPAIIRVMEAIDGLCFFNRGKDSGASQLHKHYQVIPQGDDEYPMGKLIEECARQKSLVDGQVIEIEKIPFKHACCYSRERFTSDTLETAYQSLLKHLHLAESPENEDPELSYNWVSTRNWMLIVLRSSEVYQERIKSSEANEDMQFLETIGKMRIPVNSLGFAGTLFVKTESALSHIQSKTPAFILSSVAVANEK